MRCTNEKRLKEFVLAIYKRKRNPNREVPLGRVRELYDYDPSGELINKVNRNRSPKGEIAGRNVNGYKAVTIDGINFYNHRIIWAMFNEVTPTEIDHINGNKTDNRIENLREVNRRQNVINSERCGWQME